MLLSPPSPLCRVLFRLADRTRTGRVVEGRSGVLLRWIRGHGARDDRRFLLDELATVDGELHRGRANVASSAGGAPTSAMIPARPPAALAFSHTILEEFEARSSSRTRRAGPRPPIGRRPSHSSNGGPPAPPPGRNRRIGATLMSMLSCSSFVSWSWPHSTDGGSPAGTDPVGLARGARGSTSRNRSRWLLARRALKRL